MADPVVVKVSDLVELAAGSLATGDLLEVVDISEAAAADKTKKMQAGSLKLFTAGQITDGIVTQSKIAANAIITANIVDAQVTKAKLAVMDHPIAVPITDMGGVAITDVETYVPIPAAYNAYTLVSATLTIDTVSTSNIVVNIKNDSGSIGNITLNANAVNSSALSLDHELATNEHLIFTITSGAGDGKGLSIMLNITG